jgi:carboxyl-terminal processing protease
VRWWWAGLALLALPAAAEVVVPPPSGFDTFAQLANLLETLQQNYIEPARITPAENTTATLRAFLRALDPEASLLTPAELAMLRATGVGLTLTIREGLPTVVSARDGTPAQRVGLLPGESIVAVDGLPATALSPRELEARLGGPAGSNVTLTVFDPVSREHGVQRLSRAAPTPVASQLIFVADGIAYYRLGEFSPAAVSQLRNVCLASRTGPRKGLILDLRNNPGDSLNGAVAVAEFFLREKLDVVTLTFPKATQRATLTSHNAHPATVPLAVLVNAGTAAEAEVLAAALRAHDRARLVGTTTAGSGRLFSRFQLATGLVVELPVAYFETPNQQRFHHTGLVPDVPVPLPRAVERTLARTGYGAFDWVNNRSGVLAADRQLTAALELLAK